MCHLSSHKKKQTLFTSLILLTVVASALGFTPPARAEGSKELVTNGGARALTEWRTSLYGNLLPRRTLFKVYANAGEIINLGSSALGVGSGDIVVWTPGQITAPLTVALPTPAFNCLSQSTTNGRMTTRAQEQAGPLPNSGGYTPCTYTAATTGVYDVAFYGPLGGTSNTTGTAGTVASPNITTTQNSGVSMWDITVRDSTNTTYPGRVFIDYLTQMSGNNGPTYRIFSTLYAVTKDGFKYQVDLRGVDPNAFIFYGNTVGFLNPDGITPLYHDLYDGVNETLIAPQGGVTLAPPSSLLFFNPPDPSLPASIVPTPVMPLINSITFHGSAADNLFGDGVPSNIIGTSGTFAYSGNVEGVAEIIIAPNPGLCDNANYDPNLSTNRVLRASVPSGIQNLTWDGKDNSGADMPISYPGISGLGYCFKANLHAGEYHFPLLDPENSMLGGPTITLLNPPGGTCPLATCRTAFFDDRGYQTTNGTIIGTVGSVLPGINPPPSPYNGLAGFDTASTTIRTYGNDGIDGFGDKKGMDLWTYYPSPDVIGRLYVIPADLEPHISLTKVATEASFNAPGQTLHYTLVATNDGDVTLTGVSITDAKLGTLVCTPTQPATLAPLATLSCTGIYLTTQADVDAGKVDNTANASGMFGTTPVNALPASASVPAIPTLHLSLTKVVTEASFNAPGQTLHYTLMATNDGNVTLTGVSITDAKLGTLTCTPPQPATLAPSETLRCTGIYLTTQADVNAGRVDNTANASGTYGTIPVNALPASASVPATVNPHLSLAKVVTEASFNAPGQTLHYTLVATNDGNVTLTGVSITDAKLGTLVCTPTQPATLAPSEKLTCTGTYLTTQADVNAGKVDNTAYASGMFGTTPVNALPVSASVPATKKPKQPTTLPSTGFAADRVTILPLQTTHYAELGDLWLEIPRLYVKIPIVGVPETIGGWDVSWLGNQAGWLNGTAFPTWAGNSVITAHVYDAFGQPGPFVHLNGLWYGDKIVIHAWGGQYVYEVRQMMQVAPDAISSVIKHEELPWVTLITCRGYDEASNSYKYRVAARAVLVEAK